VDAGVFVGGAGVSSVAELSARHGTRLSRRGVFCARSATGSVVSIRSRMTSRSFALHVAGALLVLGRPAVERPSRVPPTERVCETMRRMAKERLHIRGDPRPVRLSGHRGYFVVLGLVGAAALAGVAWAVASRPPRVIVMATGPAGGSYAEYGARYRELAARQGLEVRLRSTAGDVENLALVRDPRSGVSVAILQAGTTSAQESPELVSLGSLFYQAIWLFRRGEQRGTVFGGPRVSIGQVGSGTRATMTKVLKLLGTNPHAYELLDLAPDRAVEELQAGRIDGMALVAGWESPLVRQLLADPAIDLVDAVRADAFVALDPLLEKRVLPMGVADLARNRPPRDVRLLTTKASLIVRADLHSAVRYLLLEAASKIHGGPNMFQKAGQFPAAEGLDVPLGDDARQFYRSGPPLLHRYLPYWMAVLAERLLLVLVPLVGVLLPLLRGAPAMYREILRRRMMRFYGELKLIETELEARRPGADTADLVRRTADLETRASHMRGPLYFSQLVYTLKWHIRLVQTRLGERA